MKKLLMFGFMAVGLAVLCGGCAEGASSPKAALKMQIEDQLQEAKKKIYSEQGYKMYTAFKQAEDTLDIDTVEKSPAGDYAVIFSSFKREGGTYYAVDYAKKQEDGSWTIGNYRSDLPKSEDFAKKMGDKISDWQKKNK